MNLCEQCGYHLKMSSSDRIELLIDLGQGAIPLTRTDETFTPREMEQKATELAYFLRVPVEVF